MASGPMQVARSRPLAVSRHLFERLLCDKCKIDNTWPFEWIGFYGHEIVRVSEAVSSAERTSPSNPGTWEILHAATESLHGRRTVARGDLHGHELSSCRSCLARVIRQAADAIDDSEHLW